MIKNERNYSLDFLRVISMLMIVFLHEQTKAGFKEIWSQSSMDKILMYWISAMCSCSVNIFVMISGYFMISQKFRLSRIVKLVLQVVFYSWIICIIMMLTQENYMFSEGMIKSICPISFKKYWFASCYVGLCFFSPLLNEALNNMTKKQHRTILIILLVITVVWGDVIPLTTAFDVNSGYSIVWFIVLYVLAAYIRKYGLLQTISRKKLAVIFVLSSVVILFSTMILDYIIKKVPFIGGYISETHFCRYNSIFVLMESIVLFSIFLKSKIENRFIINVTMFFAPLTFGVYLIHDNADFLGIMWNFVVGMFGDISSLLPIKALAIVFVVFIGCSIIDYIRKIIFSYFEKIEMVKKLYAKMDEKFGYPENKEDIR